MSASSAKTPSSGPGERTSVAPTPTPNPGDRRAPLANTDRIRTATLAGHLTRAQLETCLPQLSKERGQIALLVDSTSMAGYDAAARDYFIEWNRRNSEVVCGVAVVTTRVLWRTVIAAMAIASSQAIRPFSDIESARKWLSRRLSWTVEEARMNDE